MQVCRAQPICKLSWTTLTNGPGVQEKTVDAIKDAPLQSKTLHQASIKACTSLSRLIVFPSSAELQGIPNHLIQESNYCERGVLLWIAQVELLPLEEGCLDCQQGLLLNCQNSHQARVEASSYGRNVYIYFQMLWHPRTQQPLRRPSVTNPAKTLISF